MDEKEIEMLLALKQTKSITHAAQLLFINQSSLSKRLKQLEAKLAVPLFIRSKQGIQLTPEGEEAYLVAKKVKEQWEELKERLASDTAIRGTLNLGCSLDYSQFGLSDLLIDFREQYPEIRLNITTDYSRVVYQKLLDDELDAGIIRGEFSGSVNKELMATEKIYLICKNEALSRQLKELPFIIRKSDYHFQDEMNRWLMENELFILNNQTIKVDNVASCVEFVRKGLGWAIVPEIALTNFEGYKKELWLNNQPFIRSTYLMYKPTAAQLPTIRAFKETLARKGNHHE